MSKNISLLDIAKTEALGVVRAGVDFRNIGEILGVPDYWRFGSEQFFTAYMGFGAVEVHLTAEGNNLIVHHAHLFIDKFSGKFAKFMRDSSEGPIGFEIPVQRRMLTFDFVCLLLDGNGINFTSNIKGPNFTDITAEIRIGSLTFSFIGDEPVLYFILID